MIKRCSWLLLPVLLSACAEEAADVVPTEEEGEYSVVLPGKADNYYSDVSAEFEVSGVVPVTVDPEKATDEVYRKEQIEARVTAVAMYLTAFMTNKLENFFNNMKYGGFSAMVRNYTMEPGEVIEVEPGLLHVHFTIDVAGPRKLPTLLPKVEGAEPGTFDLQLPEGATTNPSAPSKTPIRNFDPASYTGKLETIRCTLTPEAVPNDAYPAFADMVEDGMLDVTLWYGHDYNKERYDLREAEEAFDTLVNLLDCTAPAASFAELTPDSGPFTRTMQANGQEIQLQVRIFHSEMFKSDRKRAHDLSLAELGSRDIFFYNGHAGPWYGFYLSDDSYNDVKYAELASVSMPDKQQIVVAQGCQTYSQYADVFYANPAKSEDNLDVFTTVNFSYGQGTMGLLLNLLNVDGKGRHFPTTYAKMIRDLNAEYWNRYKEVFYGVHGIDGNPQIHPYAAVDRIGTSCRTVADCGDAAGNVCVAQDSAERACGVIALDRAVCPAGSGLFSLAQGSWIKNYACLQQ